MAAVRPHARAHSQELRGASRKMHTGHTARKKCERCSASLFLVDLTTLIKRPRSESGCLFVREGSRTGRHGNLASLPPVLSTPSTAKGLAGTRKARQEDTEGLASKDVGRPPMGGCRATLQDRVRGSLRKNCSGLSNLPCLPPCMWRRASQRCALAAGLPQGVLPAPVPTPAFGSSRPRSRLPCQYSLLQRPWVRTRIVHASQSRVSRRSPLGSSHRAAASPSKESPYGSCEPRCSRSVAIRRILLRNRSR